MKTREQLKPNFGPVYAAALYPGLAEIFHRHGYALAVHGSLARDFDLLAIPWVADGVSSEEAVLAEVTEKFAIDLLPGVAERPHGRRARTLVLRFGECAVDLSFLPQMVKANQIGLTPDATNPQGC